MAIKNFQRSFNGGEIAPSMYARIDDVKYQNGLALCKNFLIEPQGAIRNRPGFEYVNTVKNSSKKVRLIPFTFSATQTMVLEFGENYIRFHTNGATLMNGNVPYEVVTTYAEADLFDIHYVQSADVLTLVHPNYPPKELRRLGALNWTLTTISFGSTLSAPTNVTFTQTIDSSVTNPDAYSREYAVTALLADGTQESPKSASYSHTCNPYGEGAYNTVSWTAVEGAGLYRVYRNQGGIFCYIGQTSSTSIIDENITPDASITPPIYDTVFDSAGNYPGACSYFEQRRWFGGTTNKPNNVWATKSGTESIMSYGLPVQDDDRIAVRVAAREANIIRHIVPLTQLMLFTGNAEWRVSPLNSDAITPSSMSVRPQSYVGANGVQPLVVNSSSIYAASRGGHLRECGYNWQASGFITADLCLRATHLFDNKEVVDLAYSKAPWSLVYAVSSDGRIITLTYVPEQQVGCFSTIETEGNFESCCVVAENKEDILYAIVRRKIGNNFVRTVERMHEVIQPETLAECCFVDCAGHYKGTAKTTITGLTWLAGETVSILADGAVEPNQVVSNDGSITLSQASSEVWVGLPYQSDMKTLPIAAQLADGSFGSAHQKNVVSIALRVANSTGTLSGADFDNLVEYPSRSTEFAGSPPDPITGEFDIALPPSWNDFGQICVRQDNPLPLRVIGITEEVEIA